MPRKKLTLTNHYPYHITARSNNREWFALEPAECWEIFSDYLFFANRAYSLQIHGFVLMPNHFHLIDSTQRNYLHEIMNRFMTEVSFAIINRDHRENHVFGGRYHATLIDHPYYFANAIKYVFRNPIPVGLDDRVESYPWSSLGRSLGKGNLYFPISDFTPFDGILPQEIEKRLAWFNEDFKMKRQEAIKKAFRKTIFIVAKKRAVSPNSDLKTSLC